MQEMWVLSLGGEYPLEKEMATRSSILAWKIPWTEEPGGLQSVGSQRVRHSPEATLAGGEMSVRTPTGSFSPGECLASHREDEMDMK